ALRMASSLKPDVITLDLEMPKMDGFTFLRILMSRTPVSVIVISSYSQKENVFKALELGALDFVAKPDRYIDPELRSVREELLRKVELARSVRVTAPTRREPIVSNAAAKASTGLAPQNVIAIAASTGG